jgi:hypothetical protein
MISRLVLTQRRPVQSRTEVGMSPPTFFASPNTIIVLSI